MILFQNRNTQIEDLLNRIGAELQLDDTRKARMTTAYEAVSEWIEADEIFFKRFDIQLYPYGSVRIQTTVKPIKRNEFDLDVAVHIKIGQLVFSPERIYAELKRRLGEHETYKRMIELKNRCIRLNYSGDFHMDIMPGTQVYEYDENLLKVPDRERREWVLSNPKGYAAWFLQNADIVQQNLLEKALYAENLIVEDYQKKKPLQRAVQLLKRYRDVYFEVKDKDYPTSSIILTTLAGMHYAGEDSVFGTINALLRKWPTDERRFSEFSVVNPVNTAEDFTDKWKADPNYFYAFARFCRFLRDSWVRLSDGGGLLQDDQTLKGVFGTDPVLRAQNAQTAAIERLRNTGQLGVNSTTGTLAASSATASVPIKPNTFYGDPAK